MKDGAAQLAATAEIARQCTGDLISAGSTQSAALTADAIRQTELADLATTGAKVIANQQNSDKLAAVTQTAVADNTATQTQGAVATSQWYLDRSRQREEQRQGLPTESGFCNANQKGLFGFQNSSYYCTLQKN
jgi:hypothetical protein